MLKNRCSSILLVMFLSVVGIYIGSNNERQIYTIALKSKRSEHKSEN